MLLDVAETHIAIVPDQTQEMSDVTSTHHRFLSATIDKPEAQKVRPAP
jgi:type II secretory pathway component PulL